MYFGELHGFTAVTLDTEDLSMTVQHFTYEIDSLQPVELYNFTRYKYTL